MGRHWAPKPGKAKATSEILVQALEELGKLQAVEAVITTEEDYEAWQRLVTLKRARVQWAEDKLARCLQADAWRDSIARVEKLAGI